MMYGQIRFADDQFRPTSLCIHRVREAHEPNPGTPGCGDPCRPWEGRPATFVAGVDPTKGGGMCTRNGCRA